MTLDDQIRRVGTIEREHLTNKGTFTVESDGGSFEDVTLDAPVVDSDFSRVFRIFQQDPDEFEIVDDTVRMTTWQQSKGLEDGTRDVVQLYSYGARFKRKPKQRLSDDEIAARRAEVRKWKIPKTSPAQASRRSSNGRGGIPVAAVINLADIQGGKSEGGGVAATQKRLLDGLANVDQWLTRMKAEYNISEVVLVNNGDPMENCAGNYAAQLFTVELNTRQQMNFVLDVWEQYAKHLFPKFEKARFVSVLCNHGEFGRMGGPKSQTSDSDNAGGFLAESLRRVLLDREEFAHVGWTIPHDEMNVYANVAGVLMAFNHGHKIPGSDASGFEKWLNGQVRGSDDAHQARIWQTAHRHHFAAWDMGSCSVFQAPSLDGGSKWLTDMTGRYSRSGILAYLVGQHAPLGWSDMAFL